MNIAHAWKFYKKMKGDLTREEFEELLNYFENNNDFKKYKKELFKKIKYDSDLIYELYPFKK